jgi:hypothetical protein
MGCFVIEDLLIEDFPEPEPKQQMPRTELLSALGLEPVGTDADRHRECAAPAWPRILEEELSLDPEAFRLVAIPPDIYAHLAPGRGWGQHQMWTHFDGYRVREDGSCRRSREATAIRGLRRGVLQRCIHAGEDPGALRGRAEKSNEDLASKVSRRNGGLRNEHGNRSVAGRSFARGAG